MRSIGYAFLAMTGIITAWQLAWLGPQLPDPVASHFGPNGNADGWSPRGSFMAMHFFLQLGMAGLLTLIANTTPWLPDTLVNLPNKEYWLHPDRRDAAMAKSGGILIFIAGVTSLFLSHVFHLVYQTNIQNNGQLATISILPPLIGYFLILGLVVWYTFRAFRVGER